MDQPLFPSRGESSGPETPSEGEGKVDSAHRLVQPRNPGYARRPGPHGSRVEAGEPSLRSEAAEPGRDQIRLGEAAATTPEAFLNGPPSPSDGPLSTGVFLSLSAHLAGRSPYGYEGGEGADRAYQDND